MYEYIEASAQRLLTRLSDSTIRQLHQPASSASVLALHMLATGVLYQFPPSFCAALYCSQSVGATVWFGRVAGFSFSNVSATPCHPGTPSQVTPAHTKPRD